MGAIRNFFSGKKTYITAIVATVVAVQAWADGGGGAMDLISAVWMQLSVLFLRAGIAAK